MKRTTVRLDDELMKEAKIQAARRGTTLAALIEEALRERLTRRSPSRRRRVKLPTFKGEGLNRGIDLDDSAGLLDRMEEPDRAP